MTHANKDPKDSNLNEKISVFQTHVFALAVTICTWLERAGIPAAFCEGRCRESKYEVNVPAHLALEAREALSGWLA